MSCSGDGSARSRGLAMMWKDSIDMELISKSLNCVDMKCRGLDGRIAWRISGIYGHPEGEHKAKTWT